MTKKLKIAFQGEPGANSHIAIVEAYPDAEPLPCATFEDALAAISSGEADLGMIPIENSVAGRVADIHHLLPASGLFIVGEWFLPIRHQLMALRGDQADRHQDRGEPRPRARPVPPHHPQARHQADRRGRHRRQRARSSPSAGTRAVAAIASRLAARNLRPRYPGRGRRGRDPQHHALRGAGARGELGQAGLRAAGDHFCFPGAQPARRALQGDGRLCDQRRQHDQAGKLHGRRQFLRHAILCRRRRPSRRQGPRVRAGGVEVLLDANSASSASIPAHPFRATFSGKRD